MSAKQQTLEHISTALLIPYARNSRTHSAEQVQQVANSIKEFGFTNPVLIDGDNGIIAGHGRVMAAQSLGLEQVPCIRLAYLTDAQKRAYIIADNQLALNSGWDEAMLKAELQDLQAIEFDMSLLGFDVELLEDMLEEEQPVNNNDADAVPDAPVNSVTKLGDVWLLGKHRLMCGDSTSTHAIEKLMNGQLIDMVITDPPYGISIVNATVKNEVGGGGAVKFGKDGGGGAVKFGKDGGGGAVKFGKVGGGGAVKFGKVGGGGAVKFGKDGGGGVVDAKLYAEIAGDDTIETARAFYAECVDIGFKDFIIFGGNYFTEFLKPSPCWIIWDKQNSGNFADVEMAWCSFDKSAKLYTFTWNGMSRHGDRKTELSTRIHPTQKPVGLFVKIFDDFKFNSCFDGFIGSGSTLIACEKTNRICYGMELTTGYCDATVIRWQDYTGKQAILEATGQTFDELSNG